VDAEPGMSYAATEGTSPSRPYQQLAAERQARVDHAPISFEVIGAADAGVRGLLDEVADPRVGAHGAITLYVGNPQGSPSLPCRDIAAFTLLVQLPIDQSDELPG
jgi:hypothetical protein